MDNNELENALKLLYEKKSADFQNKWRRTLPLSEMVVDRWEKAKNLGFGEGTSIYDNSLVFGMVEVGKNTWIGEAHCIGKFSHCKT